MKLYYSHFGNNPSKNLNHIETSQLICFENQLTDFFTAKASTERYLQTDVNGTCQGIKKKKKKLKTHFFLQIFQCLYEIYIGTSEESR